jgi:sRNA-binding carbon storage regulator CsrA
MTGEKYEMLVLDRKVNQMVYASTRGEEEKSLVIRVLDVLPTGHVSLGFIGDDFNVIRSEVYSTESKRNNQRGETTNAVKDRSSKYYEQSIPNR